MSESTLNIPQLVVILVLTALVLRWYMGKSSSDSSSGTRQNGSRQGSRRINPTHVEQLLQMFPQMDRRQLMWDLHRNGGNVQATIERVLSGRGLETPPQTFQPQAPTPRAGTPATNSRTSTPIQAKPSHPDLITRYNLSSKINDSSEATTSASSPSEKATSKPGWSQNKTERQSLLQKRREEMILAARKKMLEKDQKEKETAAQ